jgi:hypothetical protein
MLLNERRIVTVVVETMHNGIREITDLLDYHEVVFEENYNNAGVN